MANLVDIATRRGGAIEVALIWNRREKTLVVFAHDALTKEEVAIPVSPDEAEEVYRHPFAYANRAISPSLTTGAHRSVERHEAIERHRRSRAHD
jgi:hypothetical protein